MRDVESHQQSGLSLSLNPLRDHGVPQGSTMPTRTELDVSRRGASPNPGNEEDILPEPLAPFHTPGNLLK